VKISSFARSAISKPGSDGVTLVEFALVVPLLLAILFATLDLGWGVYASNTLSLAAREGARKGIISSASDSTIRTQVKTTATGLPLQDSDIAISRHSEDGDDFITVTVEYDYSPFTPFLGALFAGGAITLSGKATMYVE
jgi:Flp pilus assembly protein TadG